MKTCKTCRHWTFNPRAYDPSKGDCERITHRDDYQDRASQPAFVWDCEGWGGGLETAPDFGCTLHEDKP
jgi:hypothetical protein